VTDEARPDFWADSSDDVAAVDPADLSAVLKFMREVQARHKGQCGSIDARVYERLCSPGANVGAVWFRASMLGMLDMVMPGWMENADTDKVTKVAATFPMKNMKVGVVHDGPPFDLQEFLKQVAAS
jgi:hypothetical protein